MSIPPFDPDGNLPVGVYPVTLRDVIDRLGTVSPHRMLMALRLERIYRLAAATGHLVRFIVFGSFVTSKPAPNDVDVFLLLDDSFDASALTGEARLLFDPAPAQAHFGASVFWLRRFVAVGGEQAAVEDWQHTREGGRRGILEITAEGP
jgi:hypothetical protein